MQHLLRIYGGGCPAQVDNEAIPLAAKLQEEIPDAGNRRDYCAPERDPFGEFLRAHPAH
jgi:hypothetical protein